MQFISTPLNAAISFANTESIVHQRTRFAIQIQRKVANGGVVNLIEQEAVLRDTADSEAAAIKGAHEESQVGLPFSRSSKLAEIQIHCQFNIIVSAIIICCTTLHQIFKYLGSVDDINLRIILSARTGIFSSKRLGRRCDCILLIHDGQLVRNRASIFLIRRKRRRNHRRHQAHCHQHG